MNTRRNNVISILFTGIFFILSFYWMNHNYLMPATSIISPVIDNNIWGFLLFVILEVVESLIFIKGYQLKLLPRDFLFAILHYIIFLIAIFIILYISFNDILHGKIGLIILAWILILTVYLLPTFYLLRLKNKWIIHLKRARN